MAPMTTSRPATDASLGQGRRGRRGLRAARAVALGAVIAGLSFATLLWFLTPSGADLAARVRSLAASEHAQLIAPSDVPPLLAEAIVAVEDERFYENHGVDLIGLGRAALFDVTHLCACQGGSTITQQLAKEVYLGGSDAGISKIPDLVLALKISLRFDKAQILADYLSIAPTGLGRHGMAGAACTYFHQSLSSLDLGEAALLAGLPEAPSAYDPIRHPAEAAVRRRHVLDAMVADGYVTAAQAARAAGEPVTLPPNSGGC